MGERTGAGPSLSGSDAVGGDHARIAELLNSEAWEKRLEEARRQREKALAEKAARGVPSARDPASAPRADRRDPPVAPGSGAARVVAALRAARGAGGAPGAAPLPPIHVATRRVAQPAPGPLADAGPMPNRPSSVPHRSPPLPSSLPEPSGGAPSPPRLETALARARGGGGRGGAREALRTPPRGQWRAFVAGAFALGLTVGVGATQLPRLFDRGTAADPAAVPLALVPETPAAAPLPAGDRPRPARPAPLPAPSLADSGVEALEPLRAPAPAIATEFGALSMPVPAAMPAQPAPGTADAAAARPVSADPVVWDSAVPAQAGGAPAPAIPADGSDPASASALAAMTAAVAGRLPSAEHRLPGRPVMPGVPAPAEPALRPAPAPAPGVIDIAAPILPPDAPPVDLTAPAPRVTVALPGLPALRAPRPQPGLPLAAPAAPAPSLPSVLAELAPFALPAAAPAAPAVRIASLGGRPGLAVPAARPAVLPRLDSDPAPVGPALSAPRVAAALAVPVPPPADPAPRLVAMAAAALPARSVPAARPPRPAAADPAPAPLARVAAPAPWAGTAAPVVPGLDPAPALAAPDAAGRLRLALALPAAPAPGAGIAPDPQPAAAPPPPAPPGAGAFVALYVPDTVPDETVQQIATTLSGAGYRMAAPARVRFAIGRTNIRYYHHRDAPAARALARALGAVARDFTDARRRPAPGRVELWVAGDGQGTVRAARSAARPGTPPTAADLKTRLIRKLRQARAE
ncbi:hypothetical protein [Rhodovulum marinum]|uniref:Uncharacterized protein n=1 Tax=Rhodovulum marinum TaxID=320662 RepID=A0A4R2Q566_9RHOB|nr:hypothetical protein [Rhodovulum marinum]TCP41821.1 hypothetical protein EV662_104165 [Rhodovulum marinum]